MHPFFEYLLKCVGMSEMAELSIPSNKAKLISYIETKILEANKAYESGTPVMSDADYDSLENELRKLDHKNPLLAQVGSSISSAGKVKHGVPMGSLSKAQSYEDLLKWYKTLGSVSGGCGLLIVSDKLDGISIDLRYKDGSLIQAVTRGDGIYGEDITRNVLAMKGAGSFSQTFTGNIRGEIVITKRDFSTFFKGDSSPRNSAAGAAKRLDTSKAIYCTVICYRVLPSSGHYGSKHDEFAFLNDNGFLTPEWNTFRTIKEVEDYYKYYVDGERETLDYEIDGLVVEVDDNYKALEIGTDPFHPEYAIAYKFPHATAETELLNITWQVGKTGRVTPVGFFNVVNLCGANVSKASLATARFVSEMKLGKDDVVLVSRRNDVIPKIEKVIKHSTGQRFRIPDYCPTCATKLEEEGEYLICPNIVGCRDQVEGMALNWLKKIGVLEWGDAIISELHERNNLDDLSGLYRINEKYLSTIVGDKRARTMIDTLNSKKAIPIHIFVGSLGIKGIGRTITKSIVDFGYDTLEKMYRADYRALNDIPGMGLTRAKDFENGINGARVVIGKMLNLGVTIIGPKSGSLTGKSFCMTGFRDSELAEAIENLGGVVKSSVGQGLTYLVQKDANSKSEKTKKALSYGTKIIDCNDAWNIVKYRW
jgi:DNA ligase (NAD+)